MLLGLPKNLGPKSLPPGYGPEFVLPGGLAYLQVHWESLMAQKLCIFVETIVLFVKKKVGKLLTIF